VPENYLNLFSQYFVIGLFILIVLIYTFIIKKTTFGRWLYCIGNNENTARVSGMPTKFAKLMAYMLAGISAALAGLINVASIAGARDSMGPDSQIIEIVTSTVIGGVAVNGGSGTPAGAAMGAVLIIVINNVFNLLNVSDFYTSLIKGLIMILAIALDTIRNRNHNSR
jgi:ribose transport system permease protein